MKALMIVALLAPFISACTSYETAVEVGRDRCEVIGYDINRNDDERLATLGCVERQADNVMLAQTRNINTGVGLVTAGVIVSGAK